PGLDDVLALRWHRVGRDVRDGVSDLMRESMTLTRLASWTLAGGVFALALVGCEKEHFVAPMKLGGVEVKAATLNAGWEGYMLYCYACHGVNGDGKGPASYGLKPPPRNFTLGKFKFAAVPSGQLPRDEDFVRIVRGGLHGTAMLEWDVPEVTLSHIIQYIKTFSPRWKEETPGEAIQIVKDP